MRVLPLPYICKKSEKEGHTARDHPMEINLRIGITDCGKYENYRRWVEGVPG